MPWMWYLIRVVGLTLHRSHTLENNSCISRYYPWLCFRRRKGDRSAILLFHCRKDDVPNALTPFSVGLILPCTHEPTSSCPRLWSGTRGILHYYCTLTSIITLDRCEWETHLPEDTGRYIWTHIDSSKTSQPHTFSKQHTGGSERHQSNDGGFMPTTMSRISMRTILDVYTSSGPAPVFRLAQATAVPFWMPWVLMKTTLDRQNLAALWVSGNSLDIAEAFHSKDWKWGIQAAIKLYQSFRWIHSHSFYQQYSKQSYHDTNIIHSYSPSHFMLGNGKGRAWRFPTTHEAIERCQECRGSFVEQLLWRSKTSLCLLPLCACHAKA